MKFEATFEVTTPLFMGGAEARLAPELRAPSMRGVMRYWLRCLVAGSSPASAALGAAREHEAQIFGAAGEGNPIAGAVSTSLVTLGTVKVETFQKDRAIRTSNGGFMPSGKDYLFWSMASSGKPDNPAKFLPDREYLAPKTQFQVMLRTRSSQSDAQMRRAVAALWLTSQLGSIGSRANRCAGSFGVISANDLENVPHFKSCASIEELKGYLQQGLKQCLKTLGDTTVWHDETTQEFDALSPSTAQIWIVADPSRTWKDPLEAVNGLGEKLRDFRTHHNTTGIGKQDHDAVLDWFEAGGSSAAEIRRAVFGLPIPFRYSNGGPQDVIISQASDRRSSPLRMRVTKLSNNTFVGVLTLMKSNFLPDGFDLQLQSRSQWTAPAPQDFTVIEEFIRTFGKREAVAL